MPSPAVTEQPDATYFDLMAAHSAEHWWYQARWQLVGQLLKGRVPQGGVAIDVGCGTGEVVQLLAAEGARVVAGTDLSGHALAHAQPRVAGHGSLIAADAECLPFPTGRADVLVSLEVIEHVDSDLAALREYRRVLRKGAILLVTVPSYESLWAPHDDRAGHRRRYGLGQLARTVGRAGFEVHRTSYYFSFLVPPAYVVRRTPLRRLAGDADEELSSSPILGRVMAGAARAERAWLGRGHRLPFGLSILALASAV